MSSVVLFFPTDHGHEILDDGALRITSLSNYIQMQESERHGTDILLVYQRDNCFLETSKQISLVSHWLKSRHTISNTLRSGLLSITTRYATHI